MEDHQEETDDTGMTDATEIEMEADATECIGEVLTREAVHDRWAETSEDSKVADCRKW